MAELFEALRMTLSFSNWPYPTKSPPLQCCACGPGHLFAHSINSFLTLYCDDNSTLTPILMSRPLAEPISALAWYDGSFLPSVALPVLLVGGKAGSLFVYDARARLKIALLKRVFGSVTALRWSPFSVCAFFLGTAQGEFFRYEVNLTHPTKLSSIWQISVAFSVDFISIDCLAGRKVAIASRGASFAVISDLDTQAPTVEASAVSPPVNLRHISFFPENSDLLVLATEREVALYSQCDQTTKLFVGVERVSGVFFARECGNRVICVRPDSVELRDISSGAVSSLRLGRHAGLEISVFDYRDGRLLFVTSGWWLNVAEMRKSRLFVSKRAKLMDSKPLGWSVHGSTIAFALANGTVLITKEESIKEKKPPASPPRSPPVPSQPSEREPAVARTSPSRTSRESRSSLKASRNNDLLAGLARLSQNHTREADAGIKHSENERQVFGNNCTFSVALQVTEQRLDRLAWVSPQRCVIWSTRPQPGRSIFMIDLARRSVSHLLGDLRGMTITGVAISESSITVAVTLNRFLVCFVGTGAEARRAVHIPFSSPVFVAWLSSMDEALIVTESGRVAQTSWAENDSSIHLTWNHTLDFAALAPITAICYRQNALYVGSAKGLFKCEVETGDVTQVTAVSGPVVRLDPQARQTMLVVTDTETTYFLAPTNEFQLVPTRYKHFSFCGGISFLARVPRNGCLKVCPLVGEVQWFPPLCVNAQPLLCSNTVLKKLIAETELGKEDFDRFGMSLLTRIHDAYRHPNWARQWISMQKKVLEGGIRESLMLGLVDEVRTLLEKTDPASPDFIADVLMSALAGFDGAHPSVLRAVSLLRTTGFVTKAVDVLLLTKNWQLAVGLLREQGRLWDATSVCRAQPPSLERSAVLHRLARELVSTDLGFALILFAEAGDLESLSKQFRALGEQSETASLFALASCVFARTEPIPA
jgi:hypothetical protein